MDVLQMSYRHRRAKTLELVPTVIPAELEKRESAGAFLFLSSRLGPVI